MLPKVRAKNKDEEEPQKNDKGIPVREMPFPVIEGTVNAVMRVKSRCVELRRSLHRSP